MPCLLLLSLKTSQNVFWLLVDVVRELVDVVLKPKGEARDAKCRIACAVGLVLAGPGCRQFVPLDLNLLNDFNLSTTVDGEFTWIYPPERPILLSSSVGIS